MIGEILLIFILAFWFKREFQYFPLAINKSTYQDYSSLVKPNITFDVFLKKSTIQIKNKSIINILYFLFPVYYYYFSELPISILLIALILIYLSILDCYYYLTDIRYILIIFSLSLFQLIFQQKEFIYDYILNLFLTLQIFAVFIPLVNQWIKKEIIGMGDIYLLIALSPLFDVSQMLLLLLYASLSGIFIALLYRLIYKHSLAQLPFIPFVTFSTFIQFTDKISKINLF